MAQFRELKALLACGGDDAKIHIFIQQAGQVSSWCFLYELCGTFYSNNFFILRNRSLFNSRI